MLDFENYITFDNIVNQLAQHRSKLSFYTHKNIYLEKYCKEKKWKSKDPYKISDQVFLETLLPPRSEWVRPKGAELRKKFSSTIELNKASIKNRIKIVHNCFKSKKITFAETPRWYRNLRYFIFELNIEILQNTNLNLERPNIFPSKKKPEDKTNTERRPLAKSFLREKIILSITNKYLTTVFDDLFLKCSYAFRSVNSDGVSPTYHQAVRELKKFRLKKSEIPLYVAECDIKKFFDCLDHDIVKTNYFKLKEKLEIKGRVIHPSAEKIFMRYLEFYSFNKDVYPKNKDLNFWQSMNDHSPLGQFGWVDEMIDKVGKNKHKNIGIPQGGALSGLIVNMVMHIADEQMLSNKGFGEKYIYLRYCDDMVIVHSNPKSCADMFSSYIKKLQELELIAHQCKPHLQRYNKQYWEDVKSRSTYLWSRKRNENFANAPWVSFLGYLISDEGEIKVRKKSLLKQVVKHDLELEKVIKKLSYQTDEEILKSKGSIINSVSHKMASMAVGKVDLDNYKNIPVSMCWAAGFKLLEKNRFTGQQLRLLDSSRQKNLHHLRKYIKKRTAKIETESNKFSKKKKEDTIYPKYPFSFYSILDRPIKI